ncbi:hypothetical protein HK405_002130 [Cladochytrium tenue]|nr:hypothetical protein HK405_002130 [Cladochytrium tenue]
MVSRRSEAANGNARYDHGRNRARRPRGGGADGMISDDDSASDASSDLSGDFPGPSPPTTQQLPPRVVWGRPHLLATTPAATAAAAATTAATATIQDDMETSAESIAAIADTPSPNSSSPRSPLPHVVPPRPKPNPLRGDRINLHSSALDEILSAAGPDVAALPSPLVFAITSLSPSRRRAYAAVREFTCPDPAVVELSDLLCDALDLAPKDLPHPVSVDLVTSLPKCEFLRVAPMEADYIDFPDLRAVISRGDLLTVAQPHDASSPPLHFLVTDIKPADSCTCIDVDISLDVVPDEDVAREAVQRKFAGEGGAAGSSRSTGKGTRTITLAKASDGNVTGESTGSVAAGEYVVFKVLTSSESLNYVARLSPATGDCDLFISDSAEKPSIQDHDYANVDAGISAIHFSLTKPVPHFFISVRGYTDVSTFVLSVNSTFDAASKKGQPEDDVTMAEDDSVLSPDQARCSNCRLVVSARALPMHEAFCRRNNAVCLRCRGLGLPAVMKKEELPLHWHCDECDKVGTLDEKPKHDWYVHTPVDCEGCGVPLVMPQLAAHRKAECPGRIIECRFCHLFVKSGGPSRSAKDLILGENLTVHESDCGSRTVQCVKCGKNVQLKDMKIHAQMHELARQNQTPPPLCANSQCANMVNDQFRNPMGLCQVCFAPFWSPRHDPGNQKLAAKIASVYHNQLTIGCKRDFCWNKYCATSADHSLLEAPMDPTSAAVQCVALLRESFLFNPARPAYHLCVNDRASATRRHAAEASGLTALGYTAPWCVRALAESRDDPNAAAAWLAANAPLPPGAR